MPFKKFSYLSLEDCLDENRNMALDLPFSQNTAILKRPVDIGKYRTSNSIAIHPMEGSDGNGDGSPGELTQRRYRRFAGSGAGLIWFEAVAVVPEGRASPRQLWIRPQNVAAFRELRESIREVAITQSGDGNGPVCIMQLTHSGRFSKPEGKPAPILAYHNPYLNRKINLDPDYPAITDDELERLEEKFEEAAIMARDAGFDGVDVKCCHRYLNCELLSAYHREGRYGGSFEGRTRFLLNVVDRIRSRLGNDFIVATRLNIYDGIPYPYGWGVDREDYRRYDLAEVMKLVALLNAREVKLINITMGTPYYNPHVNRPYDNGGYIPDEHPLNGVARLIKGTSEVQKAFPDIKTVGTGYSWLRQFAPYLAAGCVEEGWVTFAGFGREAFAYPEFAKDILVNGVMEEKKCCISCSKCSDILRAGATAGCVVRDARVYAPVYAQYCVRGENQT
jgi:2,4-dienoyl-CoA reductase-like NADH-dependent reductase (Old Yellow Enzyme family)